MLYVLELVINLLSRRKLCKKGLTGYFNNKKMYYQDRLGKTIIEATKKDRVYVLDKITATYSNTGKLEEISTGHALSNQVIKEEQEGAGNSEPEVQDKNVVETY